MVDNNPESIDKINNYNQSKEDTDRVNLSLIEYNVEDEAFKALTLKNKCDLSMSGVTTLFFKGFVTGYVVRYMIK